MQRAGRSKRDFTRRPSPPRGWCLSLQLQHYDHRAATLRIGRADGETETRKHLRLSDGRCAYLLHGIAKPFGTSFLAWTKELVEQRQRQECWRPLSHKERRVSPPNRMK